MALTGHPLSAPVVSPAPLYQLLMEVAESIRQCTARSGRPVLIEPAAVLSGRAALLGLSRGGRISAGRGTRLLRCLDGWCAVSLVRPDDLELVPAIVGNAAIGGEWEELAAAARSVSVQEFTGRVQEFGVPAGALPPSGGPREAPLSITRIADARQDLRLDRLRVIDLSSLWAGPLCAQILGDAGAEVVKVESVRRPDGARSGNTAFYDWLHSGHRSVALDFTTTAGRRALADLIDSADVVIEASRPRALRQLGVAPEERHHRDGKIWVSITGYGASGPDRVAFGDDAAVAGGLVGWDGGQPVFCGDAIADPLTGVCAALAASAATVAGGGHHIGVSMRDVAAAFAGVSPMCDGPHEVVRDARGWAVRCPRHHGVQPVVPPSVPDRRDPAAPLGFHNREFPSRLADGES